VEVAPCGYPKYPSQPLMPLKGLSSLTGGASFTAAKDAWQMAQGRRSTGSGNTEAHPWRQSSGSNPHYPRDSEHPQQTTNERVGESVTCHTFITHEQGT